jgi:hypothetical protein
LHPQARALLLNLAMRIDMEPQFPLGELEAFAARDARVQKALSVSNDRVTQYIAAGPALLEFYTDAKEAAPTVWAILCAAMDWCVIEGSRETTPDFLRVAAVGYLSESHGEHGTDSSCSRR